MCTWLCYEHGVSDTLTHTHGRHTHTTSIKHPYTCCLSASRRRRSASANYVSTFRNALCTSLAASSTSYTVAVHLTRSDGRPPPRTWYIFAVHKCAPNAARSNAECRTKRCQTRECPALRRFCYAIYQTILAQFPRSVIMSTYSIVEQRRAQWSRVRDANGLHRRSVIVHDTVRCTQNNHAATRRLFLCSLALRTQRQ